MPRTRGYLQRVHARQVIAWNCAPCAESLDGCAQAALGEVLLRVAVSWPGNPGRIQQEWLVLGNQHLTQLRDRLYCRTDLDMKSLALDKPSGAPLVLQGTMLQPCMPFVRCCDATAPYRTCCCAKR